MIFRRLVAVRKTIREKILLSRGRKETGVDLESSEIVIAKQDQWSITLERSFSRYLQVQ